MRDTLPNKLFNVVCGTSKLDVQAGKGIKN